MLGVQRPTISDTAARMQREGLITYRRGNIRPSCQNCNSSDGGRLGAERKRIRKEGEL